MNRFAVAQDTWIQRLGSLRNAVRQELIGRQLEYHVPSGSRVLDIGCGQGTQLLRLARRGCVPVGVDASAGLLARCAEEARSIGVEVELHQAAIEELETVLADRRFAVVCAHGLLMYLGDPAAGLARLADRLEPNGRLSVTFRNGAALAFRPGMRAQWRAALDAFDATGYVNELGITARADRLEDITAHLGRLGLRVEAWYGVRVFTDPAPNEEPVGDGTDFELLIQVEEEAGRRDPYRQLASQIHLIAWRPG